jgi:cobalt/nickel transport system permease protein
MNRDARIMLAVSCCFSLVTVCTQYFPSLVILLVTGAGYCLLSKPPLLKFLKRLGAVNFFTVGIWLTFPWNFADGRQFVYSPGGVELAWLITLKTNAIFMAWHGLLSGGGSAQILQALCYFHLPRKFLGLFFLFFRYSRLLQEELTRLKAAMMARGFQAKLNLHVIKALAQLAATLILRAFERSERVYQAMLCRGYSGNFYFQRDLRMQPRDYCFLGASVIWLSAIAALPFFMAGLHASS